MDYLRQALTDEVLQEISDKMWTLQCRLQSDGRGLLGGAVVEHVLFEMLETIMKDFTVHHVRQCDCTILGTKFSFKKISGKSRLALDWSKSTVKPTTGTFEHSILLLNLKAGKWWRSKPHRARTIPMGFFLINHVYCKRYVTLKKNNKTNSLIDTDELYRMITYAMDHSWCVKLPTPCIDRFTFSFQSGFVPLQKEKEVIITS